MLDIFSNARDKMVSASIETAKLAQESTTSSLICLDLDLESPVIKIPRSSTSAEGYKVRDVIVWAGDVIGWSDDVTVT